MKYSIFTYYVLREFFRGIYSLSFRDGIVDLLGDLA